MKNGKTVIAITFIIVIVIITIILILVLINKKTHTNDEIIEINYSYGGGFGTIISTSYKKISINQNGEITFSNNYNSYIEKDSINQEKYDELKDFILNRISLFNEKPLDNENVLDGTTSSIIIKFKTGEVKEIGGYMIKNNKYQEIKDKIYETISAERINKYVKNIELNK